MWTDTLSLGLLLFLGGLVFGETDTDISAWNDGIFSVFGRLLSVLDQVTQSVVFSFLFILSSGAIFEQEKFAFPELILFGVLMVDSLFFAFGHLTELLLDLIDLIDVDKGKITLAIDFL